MIERKIMRGIVMSSKRELIEDIQNLLNNYDTKSTTVIDPALLEFMDNNTLVNIIDTLLIQKENAKESDIQWLENFKKFSN